MYSTDSAHSAPAGSGVARVGKVRVTFRACLLIYKSECGGLTPYDEMCKYPSEKRPKALMLLVVICCGFDSLLAQHSFDLLFQ